MNINISGLRDCLIDLSDADCQRQLWLATKGPEVSSFSEMICQTFDDTGLSDLLANPDKVMELDRELVFALNDLSLAIDNVDASKSPQELLSDSKVDIVRTTARIALDRLNIVYTS